MRCGMRCHSLIGSREGLSFDRRQTDLSEQSQALPGAPLLIDANYDPGLPGAYHLSTFSRPASLPSTS
jgi:hypothetical protein